LGEFVEKPSLSAVGYGSLLHFPLASSQIGLLLRSRKTIVRLENTIR
jgi:hypothetical protein